MKIMIYYLTPKTGIFLHPNIRNCLKLFRVVNRSYAKEALLKKLPTYKALQHFDDYYQAVYGKRWPSIRLALLCKPKQCALLNQFSSLEDTIERFQSLGAVNINQIFPDTVKDPRESNIKQKSNPEPFNFEVENVVEDPQSRYSLETFVPVDKLKYQEEVINESDYYTFYKSKEDDFGKTIVENNFVFPSQWNVMCFPNGDIRNVPAPVRDDFDFYSHYALDAASLLPIAALNIQKGDKVADLCAGYGEKSLAILLSLLPDSILINDPKSTRLKQVKDTIKNYIPDYLLSKINVEFKQFDSRSINGTGNKFDKILLAVPCTNDRQSANEDEDNFFSGKMLKKRNELPHYLKDMLTAALESLNPGGAVVYTTRNLSPVLNDGVVISALNNISKESTLKFQTSDMKEVLKPWNFHFDFSFRYGIVVLPYLLCNYGPRYFAKITRVE